MKTPFRLAVIALSLFLAACGSTWVSFPKASATYTQKARQFSPPPGRAALYVIRPDQFVAAGSPITVILDHNTFGRLPPPSFIYAEIMPREHLLELAEMGGAKNTFIRFPADEGKCYFYLAEVKFAVPASMSLVLLPEEKGRELVSKYEQSADNEYDYGQKMPTLPR
jgi:hypothetical protein